MENRKDFKFYYGAEADTFLHIQIPKLLFEDETFFVLSDKAKILYGFLLDRMRESRVNQWFDEENRVYIIYKIEEIMETFKVQKKKAIALLAELENIGLVEKRRRGQGYASLLYVKNFVLDKDYSQVVPGCNDEIMEETSRGVEMDISEETSEIPIITNNSSRNPMKPRLTGKLKSDEDRTSSISSTFRGVHTDTSRGFQNETCKGVCEETSKGIETETSEGSEADTSQLKENNNININNNKNICYGDKGKSNQSNQEDKIITGDPFLTIYTFKAKRVVGDRIDEMDKSDIYRTGLREQLNYEYLVENHEYEVDRIDELIEIMVEMMMNTNEKQVISGVELTGKMIKQRVFWLKSEHIEYMLDCLKKNTTKIKNIKGYLKTTIFNAVATKDSYVQAEVSHDMAQQSSKRASWERDYDYDALEKQLLAN